MIDPRTLALFFGVCGLLTTTDARGDFREPDPDTTPPECRISSPFDGEEFGAEETLVVEVEAFDPPRMSGGIADVRLHVDGELGFDVDEESPWEFTLQLEPGTYVVRATARDWEGNETISDPVSITVVGAAASAASDGATERGCACASGRGGWSGWDAGLLLLLGVVRRRVRSSS